MDSTDYAILSRLMANPLERAEDVGRAVGLTRNAVSRRVKALERSAIALRFYVLPHPTLLAMDSTVYLYAPRQRPDPARVLAVEGVLGFDINHDGLVACTHWRPAGQTGGPPAGLDDAFGGPPVAQYADVTPGPEVPYLSRLEWKIAEALFLAPRATAAALARRCGLSARTCMKHRQRLLTTRAVIPSVSVREDASGGFPMFRVYVQGIFEGAQVLAILGPDAVVTDRVHEGQVYFARAPSLGAVLEAATALRSVPGVQDVKLILSRGFALAEGRVLSWMRERALAATPGRRPT